MTIKASVKHSKAYLQVFVIFSHTGPTQGLRSGNLFRFFLPFKDSFLGNCCFPTVVIIQGPLVRILLRWKFSSPHGIKWRVLKRCKPYSNVNKKCNLCLYEKFIIICKKELCSLNRRNELASSCPHRN